VLVTSRVVLGIQGEHELVVPPLPLPAGDARSGEILQSPAVQLFIVRARETRQGFDVGEDAATIGDICRRLDGLPLAIELAAARTRLLPPSLLLERLGARLDLLTEGPVDLPARQRTLRDTIAWSYELLDEHEQVVLRSLGVFRGGCTLAAAEAVVSGPALDVLDSLARQSLLGVRWDELGEPRFELLETVAEFARERLTDAETEDADRRHAAHYAEYAEEVGPHLYDDGRMPWLRRLGDDRDNFRAAIGWSLANVEPVVGMRIMSSLWLWWWTAFREARVWAEQLLALPGAGEPTSAAAGTAFVAEIAAAGEFDIPATRRHAETAIAICRQIGDDHLLALAQALGAGVLAGFIRPGEVAGGDWTAAVATMRALCEEAMNAGRRSGEPWAEAWATMISALMALIGGEPELARDWASDGVAKLRALDDSWSAANGSTTLAFALTQQGELAAAKDALTGVVEELLAVGDLKLASNAQVAHGLIDRFSGETARAADHYAAGLELCAQSGDPGNAPMCLEGIAATTAVDAPERSVRLLGAARGLYDAGNVPGLPGFEPMYEGTLELLRGIVGLQETDRLLADGAADARHLPLLRLLDDASTAEPASQR
jgi:predicted ATPase